MPKYVVTSPDGKKYEVNAPEGATQEDAIKYVQENYTAQAQPPTPEFKANAGDYLEAGLQGATFGWSDELQAGMKTGAGMWGDYEKERSAIDNRYRQFMDSSPGAAITGEILGGVATGGFGASKALGSEAIKRSAPIVKAGVMSLLGGVEGGLYGAGKADPGERVAPAATGAAVGAVAAPVLGAVANKAGQLIGDGASFLGRKMTETAPARANRILREFAGDAGLSADDVVSRYRALGQQGTLMDVDDTFRLVGRSVYNKGGEGQSQMRGLFDSRQMGQVGRLKDATKGAIAGDDAVDTVRALTAKRAQEAGPLYQQAMSASPSEAMIDLVGKRATLKAAIAKGRKIASDMGEEVADGGYDFKQFHYAKMAIDDEIDKAMRAGGGQKARSLMTLKNDLLIAMDEASPDYAQARQIFADESSLIGAVDKGRKAFAPNTTVREFNDLVEGLTDGELEMFRRGAVQSILDKLDNTQLTHDSAKKITNTPAMQQKLSRLFKSPDDAAAFITQIGREAEFTKTRQILGNSITSTAQAVEEKLTGSANNLANFATDAATGNPAGAIAGAVRTVSDVLRKKGVDPQTLNELSRTLTARGLSDDQIRQVFMRTGVIQAMPNMPNLSNATYGAVVPVAAPLLGGGQ